MVVSALPSNGYDFNTPPTGLSSTSWSGTWSDRINTLGTALQFDASGGVNATTSETCLSSGTSFTWVAHPLYPGKNIFKVTLTLGSITGCDWQNKTLSGIAIVSKQAVGYQLDMMLLDGTGAGISYRGTR